MLNPSFLSSPDIGEANTDNNGDGQENNGRNYDIDVLGRRILIHILLVLADVVLADITFTLIVLIACQSCAQVRLKGKT